MLLESFAPTTGTRYLTEIHKTLTYAINDQGADPFEPSPVDTARNEDLARARAYQEILGNSIRKSWYCIRSIIDQSGPDAHPVNLESLADTMIGNPELMRANGLYLPLAIKVPIDKEMYGEMVRRYYSKPSISLGVPDSAYQSVLLHAATQAMDTIHQQRESLEALNLDPVFAKVFDSARDLADAREFLLQHPDPRVPLLVSTIQEKLPDLLAAVFTVSHYLAAAEQGGRQEKGFVVLENELQSIRRVAGGLPISYEDGLNIGKALRDTINLFPLEQTTPERFAALSRRLWPDEPERKSVFSRDFLENLPEKLRIPDPAATTPGTAQPVPLSPPRRPRKP